MIRVGAVRAALDTDFNDLAALCEKKLRISRDKIISVKLAKKSVDARRKSDVHFTISLDIEAKNEEKLLRTLKNASKYEPVEYKVPTVKSCGKRPVIVGFGPAGMFAALVLASAGARPIILERGSDVDTRCKAVEEFQSGGKLDPECNV